MDSRAVAGLTFIVLISVLLAGSYSALMPTGLDVTVYNRTGGTVDVTLKLVKDGRTLKTWQITVAPGGSRAVDYQLDIGPHSLTASAQGSTNVTADFDIPFKFMDKTHSESFTVLAWGIVHGNVY
ncbi:MAG: hypothetical protein FJ149_08360 [Euryarchaeota archaeon]|nr:hypothetical protein [Euryarchaeota archaeon]